MKTAPTTLNDACEFIVDCLHKTAPIQDSGYPSIRTPNVGKGRLILEGVNRVSEATYQEWTRRAVPEPNDLIVAREAPAGNVAIIKPGEQVCLGQRTVHLRPDRSKVDPDFLCYFLLAPLQQGRLLAGETGATAGHVNMKDIRRLPLENLPELADQQKIGASLAAYDDLIENNRRRIALLEEAARQLYKEWFVRFRFPGHEHIQIIDGVPEGWERTPASDVLNVLSGGTPNTATPRYWDGDIGFFTPKDAMVGAYVTTTEKTITEEGLATCNSKLYPRDTLFITARGTVGKMNLAQVPMAMNQSCYALVSKTFLSQRFLYLAMTNSLQQLQSQASGAVFAAIIVSTFDRILLTKPDERIAAAFDDFVNPIFDQIAILGRQTEQLAKARDLLLPRLMSGSLAA